MNNETVILSHLLFTETYSRKAIPYVKPEYFSNKTYKVVYELLNEYVHKYNAYPTKEALLIDLSNKKDLNEEIFGSCKDLIIDMEPDATTTEQWLLDITEQFCKDRALYNAVLDAIKIIDDKSKGSLSAGSIPKMMQDALAISFDTKVGHDFIEDAEARFEFYHTKERRIGFDLELLNKVTNGGLPNKTLTCLMAVTGGGKSRAMCHMASHNLRSGYNVLYITAEMAEERIAERIDANLLDAPIYELAKMSKAEYDGRMTKLKMNTKGKLVIKEYPTASAGANNFRYLLNELKLKKNFKPDIIYIDYLNICISSRIRMGSGVNSYGYIKAIAEELRGLAVEYDLPIVTATQVNRAGYNSSDVELENTSESMGLPATVDLMIALIGTEELDAQSQIMIKQLKNRLGDPSIYRRFAVGVDKPKMRLYDIDDPEKDLMQDTPVMDKSPFGQREEAPKAKKKNFDFT